MTNKVCKCGQPAVTVVTPHGEEPWDSCGECAQKAWDAAGWKNYQNLPMPTWADLPGNIREYWELTAETIQRWSQSVEFPPVDSERITSVHTDSGCVYSDVTDCVFVRRRGSLQLHFTSTILRHYVVDVGKIEAYALKKKEGKQ